MDALKPLKTIARKARDLRARHQERHRPSGFGFALADSIDYLDAGAWQAVTAGGSVFLSAPYLRALEAAGPSNLHPRYALIFRGPQPVAAVAAQVVRVVPAQVPRSPSRRAAAASLDALEQSILVCGNVLSWGFHGVAFAAGEDAAALWPAVADALYRIRRADRLFGQSGLILVKDLPPELVASSAALSRFSYRPMDTEPNMVLDLDPSWRSLDDYLASLTTQYRRKARKIGQDVAAAGCSVEPLEDVEGEAAVLHGLYLQVHQQQRLRLVTLRPEFLPALAAAFGDTFRCTVIRREGQILGFVTTLRDGDTAVGYYIGFDRDANATVPLYFRLLQAVVEDALRLGCTRVSLGRTALEPKARLGARPVPLQVWLRHRIPAINLVVRNLLQAVPHDEAPERNPFKGTRRGPAGEESADDR